MDILAIGTFNDWKGYPFLSPTSVNSFYPYAIKSPGWQRAFPELLKKLCKSKENGESLETIILAHIDGYNMPNLSGCQCHYADGSKRYNLDRMLQNTIYESKATGLLAKGLLYLVNPEETNIDVYQIYPIHTIKRNTYLKQPEEDKAVYYTSTGFYAIYEYAWKYYYIHSYPIIAETLKDLEVQWAKEMESILERLLKTQKVLTQEMVRGLLGDADAASAILKSLRIF